MQPEGWLPAEKVMNLILFEEEEFNSELPFDDPRALHIRDILRLEQGADFAAGIIGGSTGRARLVSRSKSGWNLQFTSLGEPEPLHPLTLILGCPRPPVAKRLLKDMSSMGLREIRVCSTDLNEKSYMGSKLWREGLWREALIDGAVQGGSTLIPALRTGGNLERVLEDIPPGTERIAFDNEEGLRDFSSWNEDSDFTAALIAIGPERGWSSRERVVLDSAGFRRLQLGKRILRTETACSAAAALMLASMGYY